MQRTLLLPLACCLVWLGCGDGSLRDASNEVWIEARTIDFPTVAVGMEGWGEVQVRNVGRREIRLSVREAPEGFSLPGGSLSLQGGETAPLRLRFTPYRAGAHEGRVVLLAQGAREEVELEVRGLAVDLPWEAAKRVELPAVPAGETAITSVAITNVTDLPLDLSFAWQRGEAFEVEPRRLWLEPRARDEVEVRFTPRQGGEVVAYLQVACTRCRTSGIEVVGRVQVERLRWEPMVLEYGSVAPGREVTKQVILTNHGETVIALDELALSSEEAFRVGARELPALLAPGTSLAVDVTFLPPMEMAARHATLSPRSGGRALAEIPLVGFSGSPLLDVDPQVVDFGRVPLGGGSREGVESRRVLTVRNLHPTPPAPLHFEIRGPGRASFDAELLDGPTLSSSPLRLAVGMEPQVLGLQAAELVISVEGVSQTIPLHGWGAVPTPRCPADVSVQVGEEVRLAGADGSGLAGVTCSWHMDSRPQGSTRPLEPMDECNASFRPDIVGTYAPRLDIVDAGGNLRSCTMEVEAAPSDGLWLEVFWDRRSDVDLHLLHLGEADFMDPDAWGSSADCHYANCIPGGKRALRWPGGEGAVPVLHLDDRSETGPETLEIAQPSQTHGYALGLHWYHAGIHSSVTVGVRVHCGEALVQSLTATLTEPKQLLVVGTIHFQGSQCTFDREDVSWDDH